MREFIDASSASDGTPINRENLMAMQGFQALTCYVSDDGKEVEETDARGHRLTTIYDGEKIIEKFVGKKTIIKTTTFDGNYFIEEIS